MRTQRRSRHYLNCLSKKYTPSLASEHSGPGHVCTPQQVRSEWGKEAWRREPLELGTMTALKVSALCSSGISLIRPRGIILCRISTRSSPCVSLLGLPPCSFANSLPVLDSIPEAGFWLHCHHGFPPVPCLCSQGLP